MVDVCRQAPYGYDQRAEVLGTKGMVYSDNMYPNSVKKCTKVTVLHFEHVSWSL